MDPIVNFAPTPFLCRPTEARRSPRQRIAVPGGSEAAEASGVRGAPSGGIRGTVSLVGSASLISKWWSWSQSARKIRCFFDSPCCQASMPTERTEEFVCVEVPAFSFKCKREQRGTCHQQTEGKFVTDCHQP